MEKFAIDLDKVLDEFEFSEDRAEQTSAVGEPGTTQSTAKCTIEHSAPKTYNSFLNDRGKTVEVFGKTSHEQKNGSQESNETSKSLSIEKDTTVVENLDLRKEPPASAGVDSINHFYASTCTGDKKIISKQSVNPDSGPVSLTIFNNISQNLVQKQQNENANKLQNSYDKKLNQPNTKPSVSNVFNSLNEYINAPTVNLKCIESVPERQQDDCKDENAVKNAVSGKDCNSAKDTNNDSVQSNENYLEARSTPPKYQNILIPVKLDLVASEKKCTREQNTGSEEQPRVALTDECTAKESTHVYENVNTSVDNAQAKELHYQQVTGTHKFDKNADDKIKHTYENVDFDQPNFSSHCSKSENTEYARYDHIYIGQKENSSEATAKAENSSIESGAKQKKIKSNDKGSTVRDMKVVHQPVGFSNIDDLSEEELNKYLAELEAEEKMKDGLSHSTTLVENTMHTRTFQKQVDDEDANEAPIFESVMIGELPSVSKEELKEKAKKFPVIDYGMGSASKDSSNDFLEKQLWEKSEDHAETTSAPEETEIKERRSNSTCSNDDNVQSRTNMCENDENSVLCPDESEKNSDTIGNQVCELRGEKHSEEESIKRDHNLDTPELKPSQNCIHDTEEKDLEDPKRLESGTLSLTGDNNQDKDLEKTSCDGNCDKGTVRSSVSDEGNPHSTYKTSNTEKPTKDIEQMENNFQRNNSEEERPSKALSRSRPQTLDIVSTTNANEALTAGSPGATPGGVREQTTIENTEDNSRGPSPEMSDNSSMDSTTYLGKQPPFWVPDNEAPNCMLCEVKFTVLKRRHHCRACGKVLCNKCCSMKFRLEYQGNIDSRVCRPCYQLLIKAENNQEMSDWSPGYRNYASNSDGNASQGRQPNPNNPMEYCSTVPPLQQLAGGLPSPPTVMVPVGVLKREGSTKQRSDGSKSVMFSDGIRPGCDLTELDTSWDLKPPASSCRKAGNKRILTSTVPPNVGAVKRQNLPPLDPMTNSYIPQDPTLLPPTVTMHKGQITYHDVVDQNVLYKTLKNECEPPVLFAINRNLYAYVKIINLNCCVNRVCWNITSKGLVCVGQDEVILLVETLPDETRIPKDLLIYINHIYMEAIKGNMVTELGVSIYPRGNLLGSREHAGFLFIRQTLQCLQKIVLPPAPFLVGILVHRWETPWAKVFPLRLVLRLGAEYRYYPCPLVSVRFRDAVYFEIGHTVMKVLADFRNFAYTLPSVRGLTIHLKNRTTDVMLPRNRYDQVIKGLNNSNDHVLAYASNFSVVADSHLVCIQTNTGDESSYQTQAINIHNKPRTVTGASFIVINGALKSAMGLSAKSSIVEDGLMVEIMPEKMVALKTALKNMQDFSIGCGKLGASEPDETVHIKWVDDDAQFNLGVKSPIDGKLMDGIPSIRVHNGTDYKGASRFIRWTEVFIIKCDDRPNGVHDPVDINKLSENIAKATCAALVKLLDLLATAGLTKLAVRTTIHPDNVGYEAGSEGTKLPPIYMNSLDNELIQVLHKAAQNSQDTHTVLELIFYILDD